MPEHLSVVMPVFNERYLVAESVRRLLAVQSPLISRLDLIIVDDGSTDGTRDILRKLATDHAERITYIEHEQNRPFYARQAQHSLRACQSQGQDSQRDQEQGRRNVAACSNASPGFALDQSQLSVVLNDPFSAVLQIKIKRDQKRDQGQGVQHRRP